MSGPNTTSGRAFGQNSPDSSGRGRNGSPQGSRAQDPRMAQLRQKIQNDSDTRQWDRARITNAMVSQRTKAIADDPANEFRLPTADQIRSASVQDLKTHQADLDRAYPVDAEYRKKTPYGIEDEAAAKGQGVKPTPTPTPGEETPKTATQNLEQSMKADGVPLNGLERTGAGFQTMSTPGSGPNGLPSRPVMVTPTGGQLMSAVKATNPDFDSMDTKGKIAAIRGVSGPASRSIPGTTTAVGASDFNSRGERTVLPGGQVGAPGSYGSAGGTEYDPRYDQFGAAGIAAKYGAPPSPGMARATGTYVGDESGDRTAQFAPGGKYATPAAATPTPTPSSVVPAQRIIPSTPDRGTSPSGGPDFGTPMEGAQPFTPPAAGIKFQPMAQGAASAPPIAPAPNTARMTGFNPVEQPGAFSSPLPPVTGTGVMSAKAAQDNPEPQVSEPQQYGSGLNSATDSALDSTASAAHEWFKSLGDKLDDVHDYFKGLTGGNDTGQNPGTSGDVKQVNPTPTPTMTQLPSPSGAY